MGPGDMLRLFYLSWKGVVQCVALQGWRLCSQGWTALLPQEELELIFLVGNEKQKMGPERWRSGGGYDTCHTSLVAKFSPQNPYEKLNVMAHVCNHGNSYGG